MAESESIDCPCSNIAIMQLFHELKQRYPTVPDQIVSKVIQENYHDKSACETILRKESHAYVQSYPGAIISGNSRESLERGSLCNHCPAARLSHPGGQENAFSSSEEGSVAARGLRESLPNKLQRESSKEEGRPSAGRRGGDRAEKGVKLKRKSFSENDKAEDSSREPRGGLLESASETSVGSDAKTSSDGSANSSTTFFSECDSEGKAGSPTGCPKGFGCTEVETIRWNVEDGGRISGGSSGIVARSAASSGQTSFHNYQVALQYSMQPALPLRQGDQQRSFTTVNLSLRPPSSEPQPPIEIQSGQNLTYTTSVYDAKKGVQSQLQIRIGPALLEEQRERKDLLARELQREKEKLRCMQNDVRLMKASIARRPSPHLLPKLKAEIERLRAECERLTAAVDLYSDTQNNLPLGETNEEFYRNIYTGQRLQREGSWSCQLCTFRNHPLLSVCEECEMPRISLGRRDIHIRVTHHCPPSKPEELDVARRNGEQLGGLDVADELQTARPLEKSPREGNPGSSPARGFKPEVVSEQRVDREEAPLIVRNGATAPMAAPRQIDSLQ